MFKDLKIKNPHGNQKQLHGWAVLQSRGRCIMSWLGFRV